MKILLIFLVLMLSACSTIADKPDWFIAQGADKNNPMIIRGRAPIPEHIKMSDYPCLVSIYWKYESIEESGLPTPDVIRKQVDFENMLELIENEGNGILMVVALGDGLKEWHLYTKDAKLFMVDFNSILSNHEVYPLEIEFTKDKDWELYHKILKNVEGI